MSKSLSICPFFIGQVENVIKCESTVASEQITRFRSTDEASQYYDNYCNCFKYESCPIARALNRSYDENKNYA